jgi:deoxyribonuclease-4
VSNKTIVPREGFAMKKIDTSVLVGAHMSIAKGFDQSIYQGESIGCSVIQIFTHSNRRWLFKPLTKKAIEAYRIALKNSNIAQVIVHASYLVNCAVENEEIRAKTINNLLMELELCAELGIDSIVVHPGTCDDSDEDVCLHRVSFAIDQIYEQFLQQERAHIPHIVLESMAGQGKSIGYTFEQLNYIRSGCNYKQYVRYCIDTAHTFAAGYDWRRAEGYQEIMNTIDIILGFELVALFHVNDSKKPFNSHVDRHQNIGKGEIGMEPFRRLMNDARCALIPKILETPHETLEQLAEDVALLRSLVK